MKFKVDDLISDKDIKGRIQRKRIKNKKGKNRCLNLIKSHVQKKYAVTMLT